MTYFNFFSALIFVLLFSLSSFGQEEMFLDSNGLSYSEMVRIADGTFQIQLIDNQGLPEIPVDYIKTIIENRDEEKTIYFYYSSMVRFKVLSKQEIRLKGFVPLEKVKNISSTDL